MHDMTTTRKTLKPKHLPVNTELAPVYIMHLTKTCGCKSAVQCSTRVCSCTSSGMNCTIFCACHDTECCQRVKISLIPNTISSEFMILYKCLILSVQWSDFTRNDEIALRSHRSPPDHNETPIRYCLTLFDCRRLFQPTKPSATTSTHHSVNHLITNRNVNPD